MRQPKTAEQIRAHALVNMRQRRGTLVPPTQCVKCGKQQNVDKHHPDYARPDKFKGLCRSCHVKFHNRQRKTLRSAA